MTDHYVKQFVADMFQGTDDETINVVVGSDSIGLEHGDYSCEMDAAKARFLAEALNFAADQIDP